MCKDNVVTLYRVCKTANNACVFYTGEQILIYLMNSVRVNWETEW